MMGKLFSFDISARKIWPGSNSKARVQFTLDGDDLAFPFEGAQRNLSKWVDSSELKLTFTQDGQEVDSVNMQVLEPFIQGFSMRVLITPVRPHEAMVKVLLFPSSKEKLAALVEERETDISDLSIPSIILGMEGCEAKAVKLFPEDTSTAGLSVLPNLELFGPAEPIWPADGFLEEELFGLLKQCTPVNSMNSKVFLDRQQREVEWAADDVPEIQWPDYTHPEGLNVHIPGKSFSFFLSLSGPMSFSFFLQKKKMGSILDQQGCFLSFQNLSIQGIMKLP